MQVRILIGYEGKRTVITLENGRAIIGRKDAEIALNDPHCSRQHAMIYVRADGKLHLRDLGSTNGTVLNGARIEDGPVEVGQAIEAGNTYIAVLDIWTSLNILKGAQQFRSSSHSTAQDAPPPLPRTASKNE